VLVRGDEQREQGRHPTLSLPRIVGADCPQAGGCPHGISLRYELLADGSTGGVRYEAEVTVTVQDDGIIDDGICGDQAVECPGRTDQLTIPECLLDIQRLARSWVRQRG